MHTLKQFVIWVDVLIEAVTHKKLLAYLDHLLDRGLKPKTINCYLDSIRGFYHYLIEEEQVAMVHPVKRGYALRLSRPLPRHLKEEEVSRLLKVIHDRRDRALFMLMLRCGLRVEEVARLKLAALDLRRSQLFVHHGKGAKDRVVYLSDDAYEALVQYLRVRPASRVKEVFLVNKGRCRGQAISVRGVQKRLEHYARQAKLKVSCHQLRHTMAHPAPQCRCGLSDHPGPPGSYPDQNHPAVLSRVQSQGTAGLPPGHGGGAAEDRIRVILTAGGACSDEQIWGPFSQAPPAWASPGRATTSNFS